MCRLEVIPLTKKSLKQNALHTLLSHIHQADDHEISQIIGAVIQRYSLVYPDQEVIFLSLPVNDLTQREQTLAAALALLRQPH